MKAYIEETIKDLTERIAHLQDTIKILQVLDGEPADLVKVQSQSPNSHNTQRNSRLASALAMDQPLDPVRLSRIWMCSHGAAYQQMRHWVSKGWVKADGLGFRRTASYPKG